MSINAIIAANAGIQQLQQNAQNSMNLNTKQAQLNEADEKLDILKRTKESQINLANDQNQLSDYQAKSMLDFYKSHFGHAQKLIDATGDAQDMAENKINQSNQQAVNTLKAASQDPDGQNHINNIISAASGIPQQTQQQSPNIDMSKLGVGTNPGMSMATPQGMEDTQNEMSKNPAQPNINLGTLGMGGDPTSASQQPQQSPQATDAQVRSQQPSPASGSQVGSPLTPQGQGMSGSAEAPTPSIDDERSNYDTTPVTAASIDQENTIQNPAITKAMDSGNPFLMQGAMKQMSDGKGYVTAPGAVDVEKEKNPFFLNQWQQHILDDKTSQGPVIDQYIKKYGINQVMDELPNTLTRPAELVAKYGEDPNNLSSTMGGGSQRRQMLTLIKTINPGWTEVKYNQVKTNIDQYLNPNGANGKALSALSQVGLHLQTLDSAMNGLNQTQYRDVPLFNKTAAWWRQNASANPQLASVQVAMAAVHNEVTSAWAGAHNSDAKKAEWDNAISAYSSSGDWPALRGTIAKLLNEAGENREDQFEGLSNGVALEDYRGFGAIPPKQKAVLDKFSDAADASQKNAQFNYKSGETRTISGVTYTRDASGNWKS